MSMTFLSTQGFGGTAVAYDRRHAPQSSAVASTNPKDTQRLTRYEEGWRFYTGRQWSFQRSDGTPLVTANYCRPIVNKKASFLVGKGVYFNVPKPFEQITKPIIEQVWKENHAEQWLLTQAITGGVTGDCFAMPTLVPATPEEQTANPGSIGHIRLRILMPHQVFPTWDPLDTSRVLHVRIVTEAPEYQASMPALPGRGQGPVVSTNTNGTQRRRYIEDIFPDRIVEGWSDSAPATRVNPLGTVPLVHWSNEAVPGEYFGLSDLDGIIDLQRELNEKLTDVSDIVNYYAAPITLLIGVKAAQLDRSAKSMWSIPTGGDVKHLTLNADLASSNGYIDRILQAVFDVANIPEGSLGRTQAISNTSAAALQVQFQPLLETTARKSTNLSRALKEINRLILRWWQYAQQTALPTDLCECCGGRVLQLPARKGRGGLGRPRLKCFHIDPQTLDLLEPEDVLVNYKRKHSFGVETRLVPFRQAKEEFLQESASYWDPAKQRDLKEKAKEDAEKRRVASEQQAAAGQEQAAQEALAQGALPPPAPIPPPEPEEPEVKPEQLDAADIGIPEEPEEVAVQVSEWDSQLGAMVTIDLGKLLLVPTGCRTPRYADPYDSQPMLRTALPRDKSADANLFKLYQDAGWASRNWIRDHLDEEFDNQAVDKEIVDDTEIIGALQAALKGTPSGVAQTAGVQEGTPGNNNGAPLPPAPGPGRGNKIMPGDGLGGT